ncbi:glycosyl hydrolase [Actomonas aquatica]|uniref:Glycosyl hydrolase n=1 Tax=Actomonas aquatica TaxID=2866162 RepID=A0ABZ1CER5_9BACT|nr:glycosyl hydrolase [Opitutus sp. WL0086]WRQ89941.1 glycosyl hydrolase [Opitutus sp. WL0086]
MNTVRAAPPTASSHEAPDSTKPWTRWWWPGSAVDPAGLTAQLEAFADAGIGGVEITPIYGAQGAEDRYRDFLSPAWTAALQHTLNEAQRLGLGVDMATGTGWPFGGPWVTPTDGSHRPVLGADGQLIGAPTGMQVKRAAPGGAGLVLDPFSAAALQRYLEPISDALAPFPGNPTLRAQFHDSFEYYGAGWTAGIDQAFVARHGYELAPYAAALLGEAPLPTDDLTRLRADYRTLLGELHLEYLQAWTAWSHDHGWITRNQSHGAPANLLDLYGAVDIPETETFGSTPFPFHGIRRIDTEIRGNDDLPEPLMMKMASSAAHVMGRPLVSSETCTWLREHWKVSLAMAKPEIDRLFANGINHIFYHGTVYSPPDAAWPGWLFYASTQFNPNNSWWQDFAALNAYVGRIQTVLQSGEPDNEVLLYWPYADVTHRSDVDLVPLLTVHHVDWLTGSPFGRTARELATAGIATDYVSDAQLLTTTVDARGQLATPGHTYRALVVPAAQHLPLATLRQLRDLAAAGARIHFTALPADVPGLGHLETRRAEFATLLDELRALAAQPDTSLTLGGHPAPALANVALTREPLASSGLEYIRRRTDQGWAYFVTNLTADDFDGWLPLGVSAPYLQATDPLTGRFGEPIHRTAANGPGVELRLQLAPGQSVLLTASHQTLPGSTMTWPPVQPAAAPTSLTGDWTLTFLRGGPVLPASTRLDAPIDWTQLDDPDAQRFAGTARYELTFELPDAPAGTTDWLLDLGDVRESARVILNGELVATPWSVPHRIRLGAHLRPGKNVLQLDVTNLSANRIRDLDRRGVEWRIMHEINFVNIHYRPFDASEWDLQPSGLLEVPTLTPLTPAP